MLFRSLVDAADPQTAGAAISGAQLGAQARATQIIAQRVPLASPLEMRVRPLYNPAQRSAEFIVPGVIGVLLTITLTLITSTAIVRERERGTLEQLIVTPIGKSSLMLGKLVPFVIVGYIQMTVVLSMGRIFFRVPMMGSLPLLYLLTIPFIVASLGVGLLVSTVARSQAQAMQLSFFFLLPNILLSGYIFPRMAMPVPAQFGNHGVGAGAGDPGVEYLDDHVDHRHGLGGLLPCRGHVAGKPAYGHRMPLRKLAGA